MFVLHVAVGKSKGMLGTFADSAWCSYFQCAPALADIATCCESNLVAMHRQSFEVCEGIFCF